MAATKRADREKVACTKKPEKKSKDVRPGKKVDGTEQYEVTHLFKGYNVEKMGLPREAWPFKGREYKGKHSYTVNFGPAVPNLNPGLNVFRQRL